jgi:hypothetical protein
MGMGSILYHLGVGTFPSASLFSDFQINEHQDDFRNVQRKLQHYILSVNPDFTSPHAVYFRHPPSYFRVH